MIIVDSREKKWEHIETYFNKKKVVYVFPQKLDVGDYYNTENPNIVIDRKANLQEVCTNLQKGEDCILRFARECERARKKHLRFIVLIEGTNFKSVREIHGWKSKYSKHTGTWLINQMFQLTVAYGVEWVFCKKNETAKKILEILEYDSGRD